MTRPGKRMSCFSPKACSSRIRRPPPSFASAMATRTSQRSLGLALNAYAGCARRRDPRRPVPAGRSADGRVDLNTSTAPPRDAGRTDPSLPAALPVLLESARTDRAGRRAVHRGMDFRAVASTGAGRTPGAHVRRRTARAPGPALLVEHATKLGCYVNLVTCGLGLTEQTGRSDRTRDRAIQLSVQGGRPIARTGWRGPGRMTGRSSSPT